MDATVEKIPTPVRATVSILSGGLAIAGVLGFIASIIDEPMAKIAQRVDPSLAQSMNALADVVNADCLALAAFAAMTVAAIGAIAARRRRAAAAFNVFARRAAFVLVAVALTTLAVQLLKYGFGRAQPMLAGRVGAFHFDAFGASAMTASFPSGHAAGAFAFATALALFMPRWAFLLLAAAFALSVTRIIAGAHYPSDLLGGMVLGLVIAFGLARLAARFRLVFRLEDGFLVRRGEGIVSRAIFKKPAQVEAAQICHERP